MAKPSDLVELGKQITKLAFIGPNPELKRRKIEPDEIQFIFTNERRPKLSILKTSFPTDTKVKDFLQTYFMGYPFMEMSFDHTDWMYESDTLKETFGDVKETNCRIRSENHKPVTLLRRNPTGTKDAEQYRKEHPPPKDIKLYALQNWENFLFGLKTDSSFDWKYPTGKNLKFYGGPGRHGKYDTGGLDPIISFFFDEDDKEIYIKYFYYPASEVSEYFKKAYQPFVTMYFFCFIADRLSYKIRLEDANTLYKRQNSGESYYKQFGFKKSGSYMLRLPCSFEYMEFLNTYCGPDDNFYKCEKKIMEENALDIYETSCYVNTKEVVNTVQSKAVSAPIIVDDIVEYGKKEIKEFDAPRSSYEGRLKNGIPDGKGKMTSFDGKTVYEGNFKNGRKHGKGKVTYPDGTGYEGEFKDGEKHGKGKMTRNGETFKEGEWNMGTFYHGKIKYGPGFFYEGGFQNGLPHGKGKLTYPDGTFFEGEFEEGEEHGKGKLTNPDGTFEEGMYWGGYLVLSTV